MDGNFSAEHMRCRTREADVPLSSGMAFMANPDSYKAHLHSGQEIDQVCKMFSLNCSVLQSYSQAHVTHTRLLNRHILVGHTLISQESEQPPAAMVSLSLPLLSIFRRVRGMSYLLYNSMASGDDVSVLPDKSTWTTVFARLFHITWRIFLWPW
jgi:hypothetical protein